MSVTAQPTPEVSWYSVAAQDAAGQLGVDPTAGLDSGEVDRRLAEYGPNELRRSRRRACGSVARGQLSNPMNIMLLIVAVASFVDRAGRDRASSCWRW